MAKIKKVLPDLFQQCGLVDVSSVLYGIILSKIEAKLKNKLRVITQPFFDNLLAEYQLSNSSSRILAKSIKGKAIEISLFIDSIEVIGCSRARVLFHLSLPLYAAAVDQDVIWQMVQDRIKISEATIQNGDLYLSLLLENEYYPIEVKGGSYHNGRKYFRTMSKYEGYQLEFDFGVRSARSN